jgi:hypothetical protein
MKKPRRRLQKQRAARRRDKFVLGAVTQVEMLKNTATHGVKHAWGSNLETFIPALYAGFTAEMKP